jgi:SAM-dependent methyltransferase
LPSWLLWTLAVLIGVPTAVALFFFVFTEGALLLRKLRGDTVGPASHVYPIYSRMWLIHMVDFQPIISSILLGQYGRLVSFITRSMRQMDLKDKDVLVTSCAFGNVVPRVVDAAFASGARRVELLDIVANELTHARSKLPATPGPVDLVQGDATALAQPSHSVSANILFFLLHELDPEMKRHAIAEAARVLAPGGKLYVADFHRPDARPLRLLSWLYFKVFEPFGLALWGTQDPVDQLQGQLGLPCTRQTAAFGNFQVIEATRAAAA